MRPFHPLIRNPHLLTILGNFWPRRYDDGLFPMERRLVRTDPHTQVLVQTQRPAAPARAQVVLLHGLEGSGEAGYVASMAWDALHAGFVAHRFNMRSCGGTANLCRTLYHGGLTSDLRVFLEQLRAEQSGLPVFLIGFSLGGNVALKLAGELGDASLIAGVCAISTPLDLARGVRRLDPPDNILYHRRFVKRMRRRILSTGLFTERDLAGAHSLYEIDDRITAPSFGFGNADRYYATQSSQNFLHRIAVPTLLLQAKDDTFIPFDIFRHEAIEANPHVTLHATEYGGHLGYLSRRNPRFWMDHAALSFLATVLDAPLATSPRPGGPHPTGQATADPRPTGQATDGPEAR